MEKELDMVYKIIGCSCYSVLIWWRINPIKDSFSLYKEVK